MKKPRYLKSGGGTRRARESGSTMRLRLLADHDRDRSRLAAARDDPRPDTEYPPEVLAQVLRREPHRQRLVGTLQDRDVGSDDHVPGGRCVRRRVGADGTEEGEGC